MNTALLTGTNPVAALHYGRRASWFVAGAAALLVANASAATALGGDGLDAAAALRTSQAAIGRVLGEHLLTDQDGRPLRLSGLRGRPLVVHLIYTNCYQVCSGLTVHLRDVVRIARTALGADSFAVLTVGFDPEHDSPARLREYGRERGLLSPQWRLASADAFTVRKLADEVGFTWTATPAGFDHIAQVTVVDAAGRVVEQVYGQDFAPPALVDPLRQLAWRGAVQRSDLRGILDGVKLLCTVYDPVSGRYRFDYAMLAGILPALLVLGMAAVAILMAARKTR
jgi:protein SCO1